MVTTLVYLFAFILVLSLVVIVHEGGHFCAARLAGVKVTDFSLGFGKELWARADKKGTRWKVCLLPLGGYVKMLGDEDAASAKSGAGHVAADQVKYTFAAQSLIKRAGIIFAGPAMNYAFAVLILTGVLFLLGEVRIPPVVGEVVAGSPAEQAGILPQDKLLRVNDKAVADFAELRRAIVITEFGKPLRIQLERQGEIREIVATLPADAEAPRLGVVAAPEVIVVNQDVNLGQAARKSAQMVAQMTADTARYLGQVLFGGRSAQDMRGPLGIAEASGDAFRGGWISLILFIAQISVALGFMNLLPIPLLDGGHLAFYAVEAVRGKPLSERAQGFFLRGGVCILLALLAYTFILDVPRILQRIIG